MTICNEQKWNNEIKRWIKIANLTDIVWKVIYFENEMKL